MKLEVGKYYRTRDGRKVGPLRKTALHDVPYEYHGKWYTEYGMCEGVMKGERLPDCDIIAEWSDEPHSPVRTVTRKEIVPGTYGKVRVTGGMYINVNSMSTSIELRAAIATLTEIAEALEETDQ